jgi:UDP-galactopyranose mutase
MYSYDFVIVGAGFAGSVLAERIANKLKKKVLVIEKRNHIGGNAFDEYDEFGILIHKYGPHIFHTNNILVFNYLSQFTEWMHYEHKVLAKLGDELYPFPINRLTINKLYNLELKSDDDVKKFYDSVREKRCPILNSEDVIVNQIGYDLFEKFFKHYTFKQWNIEPKNLSPSVCGRIPIRTNDDCRYFTDKYQFMPKEGYTKIFERMLANRNIEVILNMDYKKIIDKIKFKKLIYTGPIDYFFDYKYGKLNYRSIQFEFKNFKQEYFQPTAQVNYVDSSVKFTRVIEHKYLSNQSSKTTTVSFEYPQYDGEPLYPIPNHDNLRIYFKYKLEAKKLKDVLFCGRLAEYKYYNMDQIIARALKLFEVFIK